MYNERADFQSCLEIKMNNDGAGTKMEHQVMAERILKYFNVEESHAVSFQMPVGQICTTLVEMIFYGVL